MTPIKSKSRVIGVTRELLEKIGDTDNREERCDLINQMFDDPIQRNISDGTWDQPGPVR